MTQAEQKRQVFSGNHIKNIIQQAFKKYVAKLEDGVKSGHVDSFTQEQLFFLGFSQVWCRKRAEFTMYEDLEEVHAPREYRVEMVLKNFHPFAKAFHCSPKAGMNSKHRCSIW
ncbi:hypothetical protein GCK32_020224 [Trichostrongylus colubriformis]|uniref:Peptidase M13 C-terminal domain-containing protein n=1 Tax=Trichostrongylus colubriformis TaxID=6319 RepID=A0AAN8F994_TRICO